MRKLGFVSLFLLMFLPFYGVFARDLTLENTVDMVLDESQDIKKADANIKKMQSVLDGVNAGRWFKLDATAAYTNLVNLDDKKWFGNQLYPSDIIQGGIDNVTTVGMSVAQPIFTFGKIGFAVSAAREAVKIAEISRDLAKINMRQAAINLYWSAKATEELVKIAEKSLKATRAAKRELTATGRANRSNLVKISADVAAREIDLADAKFNRDSAYRMLKVYAGIDENENISLLTEFPKKFDHIQAKDIKPLEWDIYNSQIKIATSTKWQNYAGYAPTISAFGNYNYNTGSTTTSGMFGVYQHDANVGIAISVPLFDGGAKRAAATSAAMDVISAREDLDKSQKLRMNEYNDLVKKYEHLENNLDALIKAYDLSEKAYQFAKAKFLAGQTSATELSDVERSLTGMDMAVLNARLQILLTAENIKTYEEKND